MVTFLIMYHIKKDYLAAVASKKAALKISSTILKKTSVRESFLEIKL